MIVLSLVATTQAGAKEAHAFIPASDNDHYYDPQPEFECDVAFVCTQLYEWRGSSSNRTALLEAVAADAKKTGLKLSIYGPENIG
jgi:hypothetical protein